MEKPWYIFFIFYLGTANSYKIVQGDSKLIKNFTSIGDDSYVVLLQENNHINGSNHLLLFTISEVDTVPQWSFSTGSFTYQMKNVADKEFAFYITQYIDYEMETTHSYILSSYISSAFVSITLNTFNYDDEPPTLTAPMCSMQENTDYDESNTACTSILSDPDGWLSQTTFAIINSNPSATDVCAQEDQLFQFTFNQSISDTVYNTTVFLTTRMQLDYEKKIFYSFVVQAKDGAGHNTAPNENVSCIIDVIDLNDTPPQWTEYFSTKQITEKKNYTFEVTAVDGDRGRNVAINYHLVSYDVDVCQGPCVNITTNDGKAVVEVQPIDRDAKDLSTYKFEIIAVKDDDPPYNVTLPITFYVDDIDDNSPLFLNITGTNFSASFVDEDPKIVEFRFYENYADTIDGQILIQDIDTGENAQFAVELEDDSKAFNFTYTDAFLIVPNAGYRRGGFKITVKNAKYLDFENKPWQNFSFYVHSSGTKDPSRKDDLLVKIHLLDYNDELPIFDQDSYVAEVEETIHKGETILTVRATDRDAEDATLKYQLIGASVTTSLMNIDANGTIRVAVDNAFDYDRLNEIILQVQASDKVDHRTTVPITINLLDVNNKAPTYVVNEIIRVDENQPIGTILNATIIASDVDTTRNLTANIDWNNSYAMKNSQKLNSSIPDIKKAMEFLDISFNKTSEDSITIKLIVNDNNKDETAPDYETFDTLYLNINITDLNTRVPEFEDKKSISALITVNINDINDNAPEFTEETLKKIRNVYEKSETGTIAGTIEAIDLDVGDVVSYSCEYMIPELDWFECSENGEITTKTNKVDADHGFENGFVYNVSINCTATDQFWYTYQVFNITILDKNDQIPQIKVNNTSPSSQEVEVYEKSDPDTVVAPIGYSDDDRDDPFHTVSCQMNLKEECAESFKVDNNILKVLLGHDDIDRDRKKQKYACKLICYDNPNLEQGGVQNQNTTKEFTIKLLDINDNEPELVTKKLEGNENMKQGQLIGKVIGADWDEGDNAEIDMNILSVTKLDDLEEKDYKDLFEMFKNESDYYRDNITEKQWYFRASEDLQDHYGVYTVHLNLSDKGTPQLFKTGTLSLSIARYNYYPPAFVFPDASKTSFSLSSDQEPNKQLIMYYNNETFSDIEIVDNKGDNTCTDKWEPKFGVALIEKSASLINFFTIQPVENCKAMLQVKDIYNKNEAIDNSPYQLRLTVTLADATPLEEEATYSTSIDLKISFVNLDADPEFNQTLGPWKISFLEDNYNQTEPLPQNREAFYPNLVDSKDIPKYYFLISDEKNVANTFEVENDKGAVSLKKKLDYLEAKYYEFEILASRNQSQTLKEKSLMKATVYVIDINNHVPQWTQDVFFGAILRSYEKGRTIVTLNATDLDEIDKDKLTYTLDSKIESFGSENLKQIDNPFLINQITGAITLNFKVDYNMNGYFTFWVKVQDVQDDYGNGPFDNRTSVIIYIVSDDNVVGFKFENQLDDVVGMKLQILEDISTSLGYDCHEQNIDNDSKDGVALTNVSLVNVYCVDNNTLLSANDINRKLNNINIFQQLKNRLLSNRVLLLNFNDDSPSSVNLESSLKAALIGETVVLGALCLILGVTFFLKTRELNRRLNKLTQPKFGSDESTINRQGIKAPTTNVFAVEGSNPVFNTTINKDDLMKSDTFSIHSGNSELIGVEDNPEFDEIFGKVKY